MKMKKLFSAIIASSMAISAFAAMTFSAAAEGVTFRSTYLNADQLAVIQDENSESAVTGTVVSFEGLEENVQISAFSITIPNDLKVEVNVGTSKRPVWEYQDVTTENIGDAMIYSIKGIKALDISQLSKDENNTVIKFKILSTSTAGYELSDITFWFCQEDAEGAYVMPEGGLFIANCGYVYASGNSELTPEIVNPSAAPVEVHKIVTAEADGMNIAINNKVNTLPTGDALKGVRVKVTYNNDAENAKTFGASLYDTLKDVEGGNVAVIFGVAYEGDLTASLFSFEVIQ